MCKYANVNWIFLFISSFAVIWKSVQSWAKHRLNVATTASQSTNSRTISGLTTTVTARETTNPSIRKTKRNRRRHPCCNLQNWCQWPHTTKTLNWKINRFCSPLNENISRIFHLATKNQRDSNPKVHLKIIATLNNSPPMLKLPANRIPVWMIHISSMNSWRVCRNKGIAYLNIYY